MRPGNHAQMESDMAKQADTRTWINWTPSEMPEDVRKAVLAYLKANDEAEAMIGRMIERSFLNKNGVKLAAGEYVHVSVKGNGNIGFTRGRVKATVANTGKVDLSTF